MNQSTVRNTKHGTKFQQIAVLILEQVKKQVKKRTELQDFSNMKVKIG
jgi:hypothetical protein